MKHFILFFAFMMIGTIQSVHAQTTQRKVTKTQVKQKKKIKQGVRSGELTKKEAKRLRKQQKNIAKTKRAAKADGQVTRKEKARLRKKQARASKDIYIQKHDGQKRGG